MINSFENCELCPRKCHVNRLKGEYGFCQMGSMPKAALASIHHYEEPPISGINGSGTVFFSGCHLKCIFCQNSDISNNGFGKEISIERLCDIFIEQQARGVHNINLVSATHFAPAVCEALKKAKNKGLNIPVVWNSSGYETINTIKMLDGLVDIFLPDFKYYDEKLAKEYSNAPNYYEYAINSISQMINQTEKTIIDEKGIMKKGIIIRHLVLPSARKDSITILEKIAENFGTKIYISLLNQYTPMYKAQNHNVLKRHLTTFEYNSVVDKCLDLGFENVFVQKKSSQSEKYTPIFDLSNI